MMMEGAGFEVIDLGVNNGVEKYLEAIEQHQPEIVGMSALLTTTMPYMKVVIDAMKEKGIRNDHIVLVGGAPLNEAFAEAIGADAYCRDAAAAVETAKALIARRQGACSRARAYDAAPRRSAAARGARVATAISAAERLRRIDGCRRRSASAVRRRPRAARRSSSPAGRSRAKSSRSTSTGIDLTCLPGEPAQPARAHPRGDAGEDPRHRAAYDEILCLYGDCGTGGALDRVLAEEGVARIAGAALLRLLRRRGGVRGARRTRSPEPSTSPTSSPGISTRW